MDRVTSLLQSIVLVLLALLILVPDNVIPTYILYSAYMSTSFLAVIVSGARASPVWMVGGATGLVLALLLVAIVGACFTAPVYAGVQLAVTATYTVLFVEASSATRRIKYLGVSC